MKLRLTCERLATAGMGRRSKLRRHGEDCFFFITIIVYYFYFFISWAEYERSIKLGWAKIKIRLGRTIGLLLG